MTKVTVIREENHIIGIECKGHTGFGDKGEDIVCAALSSIVQTALLGLMKVAGIDVEYTISDDKGYLKAILPELNLRLRHDADIILNTMLIGIEDLYLSYSDYIELEVK